MERTKIEFSIKFPVPLEFSERERVRKAACQKAFEEIDTICEEQLSKLIVEIRDRTANRFGLDVTLASLIVDYVLSISDRYYKLSTYTMEGSENKDV